MEMEVIALMESLPGGVGAFLRVSPISFPIEAATI